jgi:tetratricopeptide (TPR) repeat protein
MITFFGYSQRNETSIDGLKKQFQSEKNETNQVKILLEIAEKINYTNLDDVFIYAQKAYTISKKNNDYDNQVKAIQFLGNVAIIKGNYKQAQNYFNEAKEIYTNELPDNYEGLVKTFGSLGVIASEQSNYNKSLDYYLKAKKIADQHNLSKLQIGLSNNIGVIYKSTQRFEDALKILIETQQLQFKTNDPNRGITLTNIATIYEQLNQFDNQKKYLDLAQKALFNSQDYRAIGELNNNFGSYYFKVNNFIEAENYWNNALENFEKIDDSFGSFDTYYYLSTLKKRQNQTEISILYAEKAKVLAYKLNVLEHKTKIEKLLSELYEKKGNLLNALSHTKKYQILNDSLVQQNNVQKLTQAEMNFAFEKEKLLHQEALSKANNKQWFWALGLLVSFFMFGMFYIQMKKQQQKKELLLENQLLDFKQKALHLQMNPHFLYNCLAAISSYIMQNEKETAAKYLAMFSKLMRFTLESSKENWITIDKEIASLTQYLSLEQLRLKNIFDFTITKTPLVEEDMMIPPMLIQPLVENAIIHGILPKKEKGTIELNFDIQNNQLHVYVKDNGIGIEHSKQEKKNQVELHKSMALEIIKERLSMLEKNNHLNSKIEFKQTSSGTIVSLFIPIK